MNYLKVYEVDGCYTIVAENEEQAKKLYAKELGEEGEFEGVEIDPEKHEMWFPVEDLEKEYDKPPYDDWDGIKCVSVSLKVAMEHRKEKAPYVLSVSSDLI